MVDKIIWSVVLGFVLRQVKKFGTAFDPKVWLASVEEYIRKVIPGDFWDQDVIDMVAWLAMRLDKVLDTPEKIEALLEAVKDKKFSEALAILKDLLLGGAAENDKHAAALTAA